MLGFIDTEVNVKSHKIIDIGCIKENGESLHSDSPDKLLKFIKRIDIFVGHNIVNHDIVYLKKTYGKRFFLESNCIDTLYLSTLLFPEKPYHALVKDDKLNTDSINNPLNDAINAQKLFYDEVDAFNRLDDDMKDIYFSLLYSIDGFSAFFDYLRFSRKVRNIEQIIFSKFYKKICSNVDLSIIIKNNPLELAYALALINTNDVTSLLPPWVINNYSRIEDVMIQLRSTPCQEGCAYCDQSLDATSSLYKYFGYEKFRIFNDVPLQERAVKSALRSESFVVVFPTGGGKSLTYQLPAIMGMENTRGLTVVISPLQSLMKDQVDNLENKNIVSSVTINGLLDPIQRAKAIERISDGSAGILYIAPESLRSKTIEKLLLGRHVIRFVIDEAHCFSSWGHDFRVDYLYIGDFIKNIQLKKDQNKPIPVSCFTATAKRNVIEDITKYFKDKLDIDMKLFEAKGHRENLKYKVYELNDSESKYRLLRSLIEQEACPTIVYASRRKTVENIYKRLREDNFSVSLFHGGMESDLKVEEQNKFMKGETQIMVATSAFGMGVDKKDIGCIIHYEISDSLENYVQESGRAGRDENIEANCYILYHEDDLNKHFNMLNQSKLNLKEIQQIWRAIKEKTKLRDNISQSALEIARTAGWDEGIADITTRVTTAIAALEDSGYIKRGQNSPRVYADSIMVNNLIEASNKIDSSEFFNDQDKVSAKRIMQKLISTKNKSKGTDEIPESRIDYISDHLGIPKEEVIRIINIFRDIHLLSDDKDLTAIIKPNTKPQSVLKILSTHIELMKFIITKLDENPRIFNLKTLNEEALSAELNSTLKNIKLVINYLAISKVIESRKTDKDTIRINLLKSKEVTEPYLSKLFILSEIIIKYLYDIANTKKPEDKNSDFVNFSILELKEIYDKRKSMLDEKAENKDIEDSLFFLQKIEALQIEGGFMVIYNPMSINRIIKDNLKQYTKADYQKLETFYKAKMQQIHIVGEYASKMLKDYQAALNFVDDYFQFEYNDFLNKYFVGNRKEEIDRNMSPARFKKLFGSLSPIQLAVIKDKEHKRIAVAAGPGSGKTKLLVHKLASILFTEDIRTEQLLMLTFSRAAVVEFKSRLRDLIHESANYIDIKTFHSFCFDILGRVGNIEKTDQIVREAINLIKNNEVDPSKITKMVLVIDEAQDMSEDEYELVKVLIEYNENLRVIAVGDDDQNIYEFRGSSSHYFRQLADEAFYELPINYRSKKNIVDFSNEFITKIHNRLKTIPIVSYTKGLGTIKVTKYKGENFIVPVVNEVLETVLEGTTCIITRTNEQAFHIAGLLKKHGQTASLIQSNDGFTLYNLLEIRCFSDILKSHGYEVITKDIWEKSLLQFKEKFINSSNYDTCNQIFNTFMNSSPKVIYINDFIEFVNESNLSDFYSKSNLVVSTFHKAKGKEFDNVFILFDKEYNLNDAEKRQLYVGLTRAKSFLSVHTNNDDFDNLKIDKLTYAYNIKDYELPERLIFQLSHRDVNLGYSKFVEKTINKLVAGNELETDEFPYLKLDGRRTAQISKAYFENLTKSVLTGYKLTSAIVKYLVYWKNVEDEVESIIVLPELTFDLDYSDNEETDNKVIEYDEMIQGVEEKSQVISMVTENKEDNIQNDSKSVTIDNDNCIQMLMTELKDYRAYIAKKENKQKYNVFPDKSIFEIISMMPVTNDELSNVFGFGEIKVSKYGNDLSNIVLKYKDKIKPGDFNFLETEEMVNTPLKWTVEEENQLRTELSQSMSIKDIALKHNRTYGAIVARMKRMNITES